MKSEIAISRTRTRLFLRISACTCLYLLLHALVGAGGEQALSPWRLMQQWALLFLVPWLVLVPLVTGFLDKYAGSPAAHRQRLVFACGLLLSLLVHAALAGLVLWFVPDLAGPGTVGNSWSAAARMMVDEGFVLFDAAIMVALAAAHHRQNLHKRIREKELAADRLGRSLTDARLQTLKMQLNPHFLFNTLNGISVLIDKEDNAGARRMLDELSSFLRQTLRNPTERWVSLDKELNFVKQYLSIEQYRFGRRLSFFEECEPLALSAKIPPMLLQPLFENAIVHGLSDKQGECRLSFECRLYDRYLIILIFDNGENFDDASDPLQKGGIGLTNIHSRLQEVYGDNFSLQIEKKPDGTLVTLKLPSYKDAQF